MDINTRRQAFDTIIYYVLLTILSVHACERWTSLNLLRLMVRSAVHMHILLDAMRCVQPIRLNLPLASTDQSAHLYNLNL